MVRDGHVLAGRALVKDDVGRIQAQLKAWIADPEIEVIITTGGTGLTGRDVTPKRRGRCSTRPSKALRRSGT